LVCEKLGVSTLQGNSRFPLWHNLGFSVDMKLGVSNVLGCKNEEIANFMDVFGDDNDLRWRRM